MEENDMIIGDVFAGDLSNGEVNIYDDEYLVVFTVVAYRQPYSWTYSTENPIMFITRLRVKTHGKSHWVVTRTSSFLSHHWFIGAPFASCSNPFCSYFRKSFFMLDSSGAFIKASLVEMHAPHRIKDFASPCVVWCCKSNKLKK